MQRKQNALAALVKFGACAAIALTALAVQAQDKKADVNGTWKWSNPGRNGNAGPEMSLKLKADGDKLTGTLTAPGRGGGDPVDTAISDGKIDGAKINFNVVRETQNGSMTNKFEGTIDGDTIKGTTTGGGRGGRRGQGTGGNGGTGGGDQGGTAGGTAPATPRAPQPREWTATRSK
jgi:hypothetical protein